MEIVYKINRFLFCVAVYECSRRLNVHSVANVMVLLPCSLFLKLFLFDMTEYGIEYSFIGIFNGLN